MTDYTELKWLAEAATDGPWRVRERKVISSLGAVCGTPVFRQGEHKQSMANADYIAAASPDVVLSMIAEIEQVKGLLMGALNQRDTLRTQNAALLEACKTGLEYAEECLIDYDQSYSEHPATKAGRGIIKSDIDTINAAIKLAEGKDA